MKLRGVVLSPASVSLDTMAQQQFSAVGVRLAGDTVSIAVGYTATGGTISVTGLYTAGKINGTGYQVIATQQRSRKADTSAVTITALTSTPVPPPPPPAPPPAPPVAGSQEPTGFMAIVERPFNTKATSGADRGTGSFPSKTGGSEGWDGVESSYSLMSIQTDSTSPNGAPSGVLRMAYPAQTVATGNTYAPGVAQTQGFSSAVHGSLQYRRLYVRFWFKLGAGFENHPAGMKLMFFRSAEFSGGKFEPIIGIHGQSGSAGLHFNLQGTQDNGRGNLPPNSSPGTTDVSNLQVDTWYKVEVLMEMNSQFGATDGVLRAWLNGVQVFNYTDVRYLRDGVSPWVWGNIHVAPTWGGQGGTINNTWYWYLDHMYVSGQ